MLRLPLGTCQMIREGTDTPMPSAWRSGVLLLPPSVLSRRLHTTQQAFAAKAQQQGLFLGEQDGLNSLSPFTTVYLRSRAGGWLCAGGG